MRSVLYACVVALAAATLGSTVRAQGQACACRITNTGNISVPSAGTCAEYPGGPPLPCLSATVQSVPGSPTPDHGVCIFIEPCPPTNAKNCTYSPRRFMVTAAPCAGSCWTSLKVKREDDLGYEGAEASLAPNETKAYDAPPGAIPPACGTKEKSVYIRFYDQDGNLIFELRARYGCANCSAARG